MLRGGGDNTNVEGGLGGKRGTALIIHGGVITLMLRGLSELGGKRGTALIIHGGGDNTNVEGSE